MTSSLSKISLTVFITFCAAALCPPAPALAQQPAPAAGVSQPIDTPPADAQKTASGLAYVILTPGTGAVKPTDGDLVKVATSFWSKDAVDGKARTFGPPTRPMQVGQIVLPGMREALKLMTVGEKMRVWMPEALAFAGAAGKPAGAILLEIVLLDVVPAPQVPTDVAAAPADAATTKSGLASKVLKAGTGTKHPKSSSTVTVHYSGWTTDGQMFDSSVTRGAAATFPLDKVIAGWTEGLQLMVTGESRRFWIPEKLAYKGMEGKPRGMLVFDVELIAVDAAK